MQQLSYHQFFDTLRDAIVNRARQGFSLVRLGDGEGMILGYPKFTTAATLNARLEKWFGAGSMTHTQKEQFADDMRAACIAADLVGLPQARHMTLNPHWQNVEKYVRHFELIRGTTRACSMDSVLEIQWHNAWRLLLGGLPELYCISCRRLDKEISNAFRIPRVETFCLPPQNKPRLGKDWSCGKKHFPTLYDEIPTWLDRVQARGKVFLVGAGGLGKVYCMWIKQRGGVALDVGSIFDGWAQVGTRSHLRANMQAYKLTPEHPRVER